MDIPINRRCEVILSTYSGQPNMEAAFGDYYSAPTVYDLMIDRQIKGSQRLIITEKDLSETYAQHRKSMNMTRKQLEAIYKTNEN